MLFGHPLQCYYIYHGGWHHIYKNKNPTREYLVYRPKETQSNVMRIQNFS